MPGLVCLLAVVCLALGACGGSEARAREEYLRAVAAADAERDLALAAAKRRFNDDMKSAGEGLGRTMRLSSAAKLSPVEGMDADKVAMDKYKWDKQVAADLREHAEGVILGAHKRAEQAARDAYWLVTGREPPKR